MYVVKIYSCKDVGILFYISRNDPHWISL